MAGIGAKEVIPWLLALVSLGWNFGNTLYTTRVSKERRDADFDLASWKRHQDRILDRLDDFESAGNRVLTLAKAGHGADELAAEFSKEVQDLSLKHEALLDALERYGEINWANLAYGAKAGSETDWDLLNTVLANVSLSNGNAEAMRQTIHGVKPHMRGIVKIVQARVNQENDQHRPS